MAKKKNSLPTYEQYTKQNPSVENPNRVTYEQYTSGKTSTQPRVYQSQTNTVKSYIERLKQQKSAQANALKNAYQDAAHSPNGDQRYQLYAAKMMLDTPGAIEKERERQLNNSRKETEKMKQLSQDLTYGYGGRYDPSLAYQAAQMGVKADNVRGFVEKDNKAYQALQRLEKEYNAQNALTFQGVKDARKQNGTGTNWTLEQQFKLEGTRRQNQEQGLNDNGDDPFHMSPEGRKAYRANLEKEKDARLAKIQEYEDYDQDKALSYLYETMYNRDLANEQAIIDNPFWKGKKEESTALARKATLESGYNEGWRRAYDNAQRLIESGQDLDSMTEEEIYNQIMPDSYRDRTKTNRDLQAMKQIINDFRTGLKTPWGEGSQGDAISALQREAGAFDSAIQGVDKAQKYYDMLDRYQGLADSWDLETGYNAALLPAQPQMYFDDRVNDYVPVPQGDEIDQAYWWANNYQTLNGLQDRTDITNKYMFIAQNPKALEMFNEFYAKDKENQMDRLHGLRSSNYAQQFLEGMDPYLTSMLVDYQNNVTRSRAEDPFAGIVTRLASPVLNIVGGIEGTIGAITGQDLDSPLYWTSRIVSETRSQQNEDVAEWANRVIGNGSGDVAQFLLGVIDSIADNVAAMGTGTAIAGQGTKGAMRLVQLIMSGSATSNKMIESLGKGMDPTEAALYAVGDGIIEWITEKYSLEQIMGPDVRQLYGNKRAMASFLARSAGAEGSEEIASGLLNTGLDSILSMIYGHEDEIKKRYNELVTKEGKTDAEASRIAMEEKLREIGLEGLAGAISGLGMAGSRVITTAMETGRQGQTLQSKDGGLDTMLKLAQQMKEGTESRTLADQLSAEMEKGSAVSNYDLGRLANLTAIDVGDTRSQVIRDTVGRNVQQQLMDAGIGEQEAKQYGAIITRNIFEGKRLSKEDIQTLGQDERAIKLWGEFNTRSQASRNLAAEVKAETKPLDSIADKVSDLINPETEQESAAAAAVQESIQATDSMEEAIDNLQAKNSGLLSEGFAKLVKDELASNPVLKKSKTYLDDMMKIRLAAMTGDTLPRTALDKDVAQRFFDAAKAEFDEVDADRVVPQAPAQEGQGKATFNGAEYGTDAWKQATEGLSKWTRNVMGAVGEIAARFGYRVNLVNDPENRDVYGFEDANTGAITINVANGFKHHMLVTMAHEMTHWLEQNSRGGYNDLRSFVLESLRKEGVNVQERIVKIMDNYNMVMKPEAGKGMTINQAMAELVAQSSEGLLSSRRAAMELQSINPTLYGRVQNYVKNMIARLDAAIHSMEYEASMSQEAKALKNYREQLADIWFTGRKDAQGQQGPIVTQEAPQAEEQTEVRNEAEKPQNVQYSVAQRDEAYQQAVESGNRDEAQYYVNEAAQDAGFDIENIAYHGTDSFGFTEFDMQKSQNQIFVAYKKALSGTYTHFPYVSKIGKNFRKLDLDNMGIEELVRHYKEHYRDVADSTRSHTDIKTYSREQFVNYVQGIIDEVKEATKDKPYGAELEKHLRALAIYEIGGMREEAKAEEAKVREIKKSPEFDIEGELNNKLSSLLLTGMQTLRDGGAVMQEMQGNGYSYMFTENEVRKSLKGFDEDQGIYELYTRPGNQLVIDAQDKPWFAIDVTDLVSHDRYNISTGEEWTEYDEGFEPNADGEVLVNTRTAAEWARNHGYDSVRINNVYDNGGHGYNDKETAHGDIGIFFNQEDVKSADPVTYDDEGNVIPPSQRFNEQQKDIRFSLANAVEERQDGLIAVHNLTVNNLKDTLQEGGFTAPSIAVIKAKTGHSKFGEISVVFSKDTIDPQRDRSNKIYGADAWTPTRSNAQIETKIDYDKMMEAKKKVNKIMENADPYYAHEAERWIGEKAYHDDTNKTLDEWADQAAFNEGMLAAFMTAEGQEIKKEYRHIPDDNELTNDEKHLNMYNSFLERMEKWGLLNSFMESMKNNSVEVNNVNWASHLAESSDDETIKKVANNALSENPGISKRILSSWLRQIYKYEQAGREIKYHDELDRYKMRETMQNTVNRPRFNKWITNLFSSAFGERGVYNGADPYYRNGDRKSWKSLHWAPTAENIVRAMYINHEAKGGEAGGATGLIAKASKEYKNIDQVRQDSGRLQLLDEKEYEEKINQLDEELNEFISEIEEETGNDFYSIKEGLIDAAGQYAKSEKIDWFNYALNDYGIKLTEEQTAKAKELLEKARNIETGYFEAKPERVVGLHEITRVIVPEGTDQALIDALDNAGIEYDTYDGTDEDRLKKLNAVPNVQFSIRQSPDMEVNNFMMGLNEFNLPTYQEKTMLRQYKDARTRAELLRYGIRERENERKKLLAMEKRGLKENKRLSQINDFLTRDRARLNQLEKTLVDVTRDKGYARLMMNQKNLMDNLVSGRTAGELEETVNNIQKNLDDVTKEMAERAENLKKLASAEAVLKIRQMFDTRGLKAIAAKLKNDLGSELENKEIENRLAMIALKMKEGKYDAETAEELADLLAGRMQGEYEGYFISELRGSTITLGPAQLKELKGSGRSLSDIRQQLAGTGIRIGTKGSTTLDAKWDELCDIFPTLDRNESAGNMLDVLLDKITSEKNEQPTVYNNEQLMDTNRMILEAAQKLIPEIITDENSLKLIRETMAFVAKVSGAAKSSAEAMDDINAMISQLQKKSSKAIVTARKLTGDIGETIEYFDQLSLQSEAAMWKQERIRLIDQLKSENTKALMEEADKWREKIEKDKAFRELAGENLHTRRKITTNVSRLRKLLINETDLKNIPEHMKGLAREMLGKIVDNDLARRKLTGIDRKDLAETGRVLEEMKKLDGDFTPDDLRLIADEEAQAVVMDALADLEEGLEEYNSHRTGTMMDNANAVKATLDKISDAVSKITGIINAERSVAFLDRQVTVGEAADDVRKDFQNSRFKGELAGRGSKAVNTVKRTVVYGNMTPEYYIENLRNKGMTELWQDAKRGENRNGMEVRRAKERIGQLAEETGYKAWADEKKEVTVGGRKRTLKIGSIMELYAIWKREHTSNPEMSQHLAKGGVFFQEDNEQDKEGVIRHVRTEQRAVRVTDEEIQAMYDSLTAQQKQLIDGVVKYLSSDMSDLGNEASMRMYGIKKYKETYYFPMKVWDGVKAARSDKGITGTTENRSAHYSWSKRRQHMASNALVIGDFMTDAINHIVEMINYNTMAPAIENINKVLNYKFTEDVGTDDETKRTLRAMFQENYGTESLKYMEQLLQDMNGGPAQDQRKTLRDRALSIFKKNAVAGSMSVALQQPLSYIRAAMMINPKYLTEGLAKFWKGSYQEMISHSGVAVIKDMGKFDMNFGQSAKDYIMPETKKSLYGKATDVLTVAPQLMDTMTWTRMWSAVKAEQAAKNPGMDTKSEAFMNLVTERFNDLVRKTQVYDSVLVKSSNMRSQNLGMKVITSFMAEPTLSLNVLADAIRNTDLQGGKAKLAKAGATFLVSAVMQAAVKGLMGSGRTPDRKKTWLENFLNKLQYNLMNEANPVSLIPGYSDIIEVLKTGELKDDAMGAIGKLFSIGDTIKKAAQGNGKGWYRDIEDTAAQFAQLFTNIPAKNLMRDMRAVYNWISGTEYASRPTSGNVLKYQREANWFTGDDLLGVLNAWLGEAGFKTTAASYYGRMYNAMKNGDQGTAEGLKEYMSLGRGTSDDAIKTGLKNAAKKDKTMTEAQKDAWMIDNDLMGESSAGTITTQYKEGKISAAEARKLWKELDPKLTDNDLYWKQDRADYQKETGIDVSNSYNYRLKDAVASNKGDNIRKAVKGMLDHGRTQKQVKDALSDWKSEYLAGDQKARSAIRNAMQIAYKALGLTAADADKTIEGWKKSEKKTKK